MSDRTNMTIRMGNCEWLISRLPRSADSVRRSQIREVRYCLKLAREAVRAGDMSGAGQEIHFARLEAADCGLPALIRDELESIWIATRDMRVPCDSRLTS